MSTQVSPQIKILAAVGLLLALVLGGSMMLMGKSSSSSSASAPTVTQPVRAHSTPARPSSATTTPATHSTRTTPAAPATSAPRAATQPTATTAAHTAAPKATPAKPVKPKVKAVPEVAANGLPGVLDELLHIHSIVVVALWDPEIPSDRIAMNEAQAGAKGMNAGFLAVNVLDERVASPLTAIAGNGGLLPSPGVLIYRQPSVLVNTIKGFADRDAVAQAVADAMLIDPSTVAAAATAPVATTPAVTTTTPTTTP